MRGVLPKVSGCVFVFAGCVFVVERVRWAVCPWMEREFVFVALDTVGATVLEFVLDSVFFLKFANLFVWELSSVFLTPLLVDRPLSIDELDK